MVSSRSPGKEAVASEEATEEAPPVRVGLSPWKIWTWVNHHCLLPNKDVIKVDINQVVSSNSKKENKRKKTVKKNYINRNLLKTLNYMALSIKTLMSCITHIIHNHSSLPTSQDQCNRFRSVNRHKQMKIIQYNPNQLQICFLASVDIWNLFLQKRKDEHQIFYLIIH